MTDLRAFHYLLIKLKSKLIELKIRQRISNVRFEWPLCTVIIRDS